MKTITFKLKTKNKKVAVFQGDDEKSTMMLPLAVAAKQIANYQADDRYTVKTVGIWVATHKTNINHHGRQMSPTKHHKAMAQQFKDYQAAKTVVKTLGDYELIRLAEYKGHGMNMGKHKYFYDVEFRLVLKGHDHGDVKGTKKELLQDLENIAADAPKLRLYKLEM